MIKKVLVESNGFVSHIFHDDGWVELELQEGQTLEEREYEQIDGGWYPIGQTPKTDAERILELEQQVQELLILINK